MRRLSEKKKKKKKIEPKNAHKFWAKLFAQIFGWANNIKKNFKDA